MSLNPIKMFKGALLISFETQESAKKSGLSCLRQIYNGSHVKTNMDFERLAHLPCRQVY